MCQAAGEPLLEPQSVTARETFGANDLPLGTTLELGPGDVVASVVIQGHAPVLLTSLDGSVSRFPRAWATVDTADGRTGVGWIEWNRNVRCRLQECSKHPGALSWDLLAADIPCREDKRSGANS